MVQGFLLPQKELNADNLANILAKLDRKQILEIANKAYSFANPQATEQCAKIILDNLH